MGVWLPVTVSAAEMFIRTHEPTPRPVVGAVFKLEQFNPRPQKASDSDDPEVHYDFKRSDEDLTLVGGNTRIVTKDWVTSDEKGKLELSFQNQNPEAAVSRLVLADSAVRGPISFEVLSFVGLRIPECGPDFLLKPDGNRFIIPIRKNTIYTAITFTVGLVQLDDERFPHSDGKKGRFCRIENTQAERYKKIVCELSISNEELKEVERIVVDDLNCLRRSPPA